MDILGLTGAVPAWKVCFPGTTSLILAQPCKAISDTMNKATTVVRAAWFPILDMANPFQEDMAEPLASRAILQAEGYPLLALAALICDM